MSKLAVLGVLIVAHLSSGSAHSGHTYNTAEVERAEYSWEEAEGYEECAEFLIDPEQDHFRKHPKPKPIEEICGIDQCPMYQKVKSSGCGFEKRIILRANWTTTNVDLESPNGYREAYFRLYGYRSGAKNDRGEVMDMAVPVIKKWWLDEDFNVLGATMSFYIPAAFQSDPPASTDDLVRVEEWDEAVTYTRAFGGNREDPEHLKQFDLLKTALTKENLTPYPYMRMTAGFTRPGYGRQRREVILVDNDSM